MSTIIHKELQVKSTITKLKGHSAENFWSISKSTNKDTFVSNVKAEGSKDIVVNELYQGPPADVPIELLDDLLCSGDSSYNPSRPFRWYKDYSGMTICVDTSTPESIHEGRMASLKTVLDRIDNPETIFIYELEIN